MDFEKIWDSIKNFFVTNGWHIVEFFAALILGIIVIKVIVNLLKKVMNKTNIEKITFQFIIGIIKFLLYLFLVLILLNIIGIQITGILTAFSAVLLAVGVALEKNIANFANGLIIVTTQMFDKGDYIALTGDIEVEGSIDNINFLFTTLTTKDNKKITLPNSAILESGVTNYSAHSTRRIDNTFSVAYESDVELVKQIIMDVMKSNGNVYLDKPMVTRMSAMSASSLDFSCYCWVDREDYFEVNGYIKENVYNEFKRHGISVPYNQLEVRTRTDEVVLPIIGNSLPERVEKVREEKTSILENVDISKIFKKKSKKILKKENAQNTNNNSNNSNNNANK